MRDLKKVFTVVLILSLSALGMGLSAEDAKEKRPFTIADYAHWRAITSTAISADGNWVCFAYAKVKADDEFTVKSLTSEIEYRIPRASRPQFSDDSAWVAYILSLPYKEAEKLRKDKKPVPQKAELLNLETGGKTTFDNAAAFSFSKGSRVLAVKKTKADPKSKHNGSDLILVDLKKDTVQNLGNVGEFAFNKSGTLLAYTIDAADQVGNGVHVWDPSTGTLTSLDSGKADYARLAWHENGKALAVLKGNKKKEYKQKDNVLLVFSGLGEESHESALYDPAQDASFPGNMVLSEKTASPGRTRRGAAPSRGNLFWSEDGRKVFCGIKEQEKELPKPDPDADPPADVDIWHVKDEYLQSVQMIRANRDRNFTYRSVFNIDSKRFFRLADEKMRTVTVTRDGKWGIGRDDKAYLSDWKEPQADYYRIDTATGEKTLIFKGQKRTLGLSPDSRHFLFWKDGHIWGYVLASGEIRNLTGNAPVSFVNDEYDHPGTKPPYGVTGWSKDGGAVILTHKYDLYLQPLDGRPAENLTHGLGTAGDVRLRYIQTDPEAKSIDLTQPLLLSAFGRWTKKSGFYRLTGENLEELVFAEKYYGRISKAKKADRYLYTIESFKDFPNCHVSDGSFENPRRVTDANPHQSEFKWGTNILIEYANKNGVRLQGVLMVPEDHKPGQKLPMLVDFYEKNSQNLFRFSRMIYRDTPMFYKYVSNGYLVLLPDVHFNTRTTHSDMLDCVEAAVKKVIALGYADPDRIGLHGHSFSGQGGAFIATKSKMFAAVVAGAAATNLVSDFNQLWKSSGTNQHRYDYYGQGRFGTNPIDDLELYIQESALFNARTMDTPLLLLHGTADGSVEWLQAVEFYNALRFLGKNVILLSYPGQGHHATKLENKKDFQIRMEQFYDHYLKDKPAPEWMVKGVPFLNKKTLK